MELKDANNKCKTCLYHDREVGGSRGWCVVSESRTTTDDTCESYVAFQDTKNLKEALNNLHNENGAFYGNNA